MKEKVEVKICTGTLCYVMGGAELQLLDEHIPEDLLSRVEISGTPCLGICDTGTDARAPFVKVGDRIISDAGISKVIAAIREELND